ncbi:MAG TPA: ISAs1 family transposase [Rhabdochlamydiaceae bacterium]
MKYPEWVSKHKLPNTEIRCIRGRYYLYNITSVWSPEKKRTKKVTLKSVGTITEEFGLIPAGMSRKGKVPKGESRIKDNKPETSFMDTFGSLDDPRAERNQLYSVFEILLVTFLSVICGAEGWQDIENYGKAKINYLRRYADFSNGIPSDDTFRRFFRSIDIEQFKEMFRVWVQSLATTVGAKVIAIDGKSNRRTYDGDGNMLHMVSAFASEARIVLGQEKVSEKSNEITAIPKMISWLDVKGHIVTIDAMGCQYAIADQIVKKEGNYIFSLKGNQGNLSKDVGLYFADPVLTKTLKSYTHHDKGHGRIETRACAVSNDVEWLRNMHPRWKTIHSIIQIYSKRELKNKTTEETRYYVSSLKDSSPEETLKAIRDHWGIENTLHWILDMSFNEDYSRIRKENAPQVMAIIRHFALNLLQQNKPKRQSIKGFRKICAWDDEALGQIIAKANPS